MAKKIVEIDKDNELLLMDLQRKDVQKNEKKRSITQIVNDALRIMAKKELENEK